MLENHVFCIIIFLQILKISTKIWEDEFFEKIAKFTIYSDQHKKEHAHIIVNT